MPPPGFFRLERLREGGPPVTRALHVVICPSGVRASGSSSIPNRGVALRRLWMVWLTGAGLLAAGCSSSSTSTPSTSAHAASNSASASPNPCATVTTTTSIDQVPTACAALWAPYDVTKVPPPDILQQEHVPPAPRVVNMTNGAVSDAEAQMWANASNRGSGWFKWAEANDQPGLLPHLVASADILPAENLALSQGASIALPDCSLYPLDESLFPIGPDGQAYFSRKGLPTKAKFVLVARFSGPCVAFATFPDGHQKSITELATQTTVFGPGILEKDPVLGVIWFTDSGGNCTDTVGAPSEWCGR